MKLKRKIQASVVFLFSFLSVFSSLATLKSCFGGDFALRLYEVTTNSPGLALLLLES